MAPSRCSLYLLRRRALQKEAASIAHAKKSKVESRKSKDFVLRKKDKLFNIQFSVFQNIQDCSFILSPFAFQTFG